MSFNKCYFMELTVYPDILSVRNVINGHYMNGKHLWKVSDYASVRGELGCVVHAQYIRYDGVHLHTTRETGEEQLLHDMGLQRA